ncbi:Isoprenoid synthase domain containing protein [Amanita muscaria]
MEQTYARNIKNVCESILARLDIPYNIVETDPAFYADCRAAAIERGIPLEGEASLGRFFHTGVDLGAISYGHLEYETRVYVAIWGATAAACEDTCNNDIDLLKNFCHRYVNGAKHGHPLVDAYDSLLRELPKYFEPFAAETLLQSGMDFFVGLVWEYELQKNPATHAKDFPVFMKNLAGLSRMCAMLAFPRGISLRSYMEAIPGCMTYVNVINDIFSFYKEELAGESINFVSTMAESSKKTKIEVLQQLADETVETYKEVTSILSGSAEALQAFEDFVQGYLYFHVANKRYKVAELWAICGEEQL